MSTTIPPSPRHLRPGSGSSARLRRNGGGAGPPRRRGRSIRSRLLLILAVPTAALLVVAALAIANQLQAYREAGAAVSGTRLTLVAQDLVHELQRERGLSNGLLGGQQEYATALDQQRVRADRARAELDAALDGTGVASAVPLRAALARLDGQPAVRADVDRRTADQARTLQFYTGAIVALNDAGATDTAAVSDTGLRAGLDTLRTLGQTKEATALERGFLNGVFSADAFRAREYARFTEIRGQRLAGLQAFSRQATEAQQAALDTALASPAAQRALGFEQRAVDGPTAPALGVPAPQWWDAMTVLVDDLRAVQQQVGGEVEARAVDLRGRALALLLLLVGLGLAALAVAVALAVVVARSITRPLGLVAAEAARLPDDVARIQSADGADVAPRTAPAVEELQARGDEIADVAGALTQVQRTALRLASEQAHLRRTTAESMANLGRRNQNLLRRLLGFISHLERDEQDPDALANLFEIDHLATRMRRNAESLLVLVGERSPRQATRPVPIGDIVRAALSEVEEYRRVALHRLEDVLVVGSAGADLAHLVAELLENALSFSPPDRDVEVHGRRIGGDYVLAVLDHGIGMSADDLAIANGRLAGAEIFDVAPTRYLGHHVIGQLAARHEVRVRLHESPVTGITARVTLPAALLVTRPVVEAAPARGDANGQAVLLPSTGGPARPGRVVPVTPVALLEKAPSEPAPALPPAPVPGPRTPEPWTSEPWTARPWTREPSLFVSPTPTPVSTPVPAPSSAPAPPTSTPAAPAPAAAPSAPAPAAAPSAPSAPSTPSTPAPVAPERTRNGLVKRVRAAPGGATASGAAAEPRAPQPRSATDVRATLNGFRAGFERREQERGRPGDGAGPPQDGAP